MFLNHLRSRASRRWLLPAIASLAIAGSAVGESTSDPLVPCEVELAAAPEAYEPHLCFLRAALAADAATVLRARDRLELRRREAPELGWAALVLGNFAYQSGETNLALERYAEARDRFGARGEDYGRSLALSNRRHTRWRQGDVEGAAEEVEAARELFTSPDRNARAQALSLDARHRLDALGDLDLAYRALVEASAAAFPDGPFGLRRTVLFLLTNLAFHLGRYPEALDAHAELEALLEEHGSPRGLAINAFNWANTRQAMLEVDPEPGGLAELGERVRHALELAETYQEPTLAGRSHALLAQIEALDRPAVARRHLDRCHALATEHDLGQVAASCWWTEVLSGLRDDAGALDASARALAVAEATGNSLYRAHAWRARIRAAWRALPQAEAEAEIDQALAAIEALRSEQRDAGHRAEMITHWTADYTWVVGRRLERDDLAGAFDTIERLRARVLLENLDRPAPVSADEAAATEAVATEDREALNDLRRQLAEVQRRLLDPELPDDSRRRLLDELGALETRERGHRRARIVDTERVDLATVQSHLGPDEALLVFQLELDRDLFGQAAGGSWALVVTANDRHAVRLPERTAIAPVLPLLRGLIDRRDGGELETARRLYERLMAPIVEVLPDSVERLVLIPDDRLHQLPFALLESPDGPLGLRFELVVAPSATLWHRWSQETVRPAEEPVLTLADPSLPHTSDDPSATRNAVLLGGLRLGALPRARIEGRGIRRHLGGELWMGDEASELRLKQENLGRFAVVHFATHALADLEHPQRSSLLLAAGGDGEDGLLRAPEIADLDFTGRMVTLSACRTSDGEVLRGEGMMSLSRTFFEAGAHTVVGSRWPLRDADAEVFFGHFYRRMAAGATAAAALRGARQDTRDDGLPAEAWAGPVLIGRGEFTLTADPGRDVRWVAAGVAVLIAVVGVLRRRIWTQAG